MKNYIKTALALIIAAIMLCSCGAGSGTSENTGTADTAPGETDRKAYQIYKSAEDKTNSLRRYAANVDLRVDVDYGTGTTYNLKSLSAITADLDAMTSYRSFEYSGTDSPMDSKAEIYHESGTTYYTDGTNSYKYAEDDETAMSSAGSAAAFGFPDNFSDSGIRDENGATVVTAKLDGDDVKDICGSYLSMISGMTGVDITFDFSEVDATITVDSDGYLTGMKLSYSAKFDFVGSDANAIVTSDINYADVSGNAVPAAPDGYKDFPDYDPNAVTTEDPMGGMSEEAIDAAIALFKEDHVTPVDDYAEKYAEACSKYGKDMIDSIISIVLGVGSITNGK